MSPQNGPLRERLSRCREVTITVTGRRSGRKISNPVWFVFEDPQLYLLPVQGSATQWYRNVLKAQSMQIEARGAAQELRVATITDPQQVSAVVEKFREKYGAGDVKKYYSNFDVAVIAKIL